MGGKKKRHETTSLRSSSMRHDSVSPATTARQTTSHVASVGCMSGIFHFVSKYHTRRKFLTFGKNQERKATSPPPLQPQSSEIATCQSRDHEDSSARLSLEVPRSPAIPADIRKSSLDSLDPPRVVERLMGLDNTMASAKAESAVEKRRKLLGALERCDEDLQALRKIIEAVRATQTPPLTPPHVVRCGGAEEEEERENEVGSEGPSPVSVLDHHMLLTRSPSISCSKRTSEGEIMNQQRQQTSRKKAVEEDKAINFCSQYRPSSTVVTTSPQSLHFPTEIRQQLNIGTPPSPAAAPWSSAVRETVIEVCRDVEEGQRREVGSIGLLLQDIICRDLIDEVILEIKCWQLDGTMTDHLPHQVCKRKLDF